MKEGVLIVVPALDEAQHVGAVLDGLVPFIDRATAAGRTVNVVVADGGSRDATRAIARAHPLAARGRAHVLDNPDRLQSAGVNRAVAAHGARARWLIRLDAHARYPADYCDALLEDGATTGADSVVVAMRAVGETGFQRIAALAQNARIGNGGSSHRMQGGGRFVAHGHHALMRLDAFRAAGGYDAAFSHNEDAELDHRLVARGGRIWLSGRTGLDYLPRRSLGALLRQYRNFGRGRAATMRKHRIQPGLRQLAVILVLPAAGLALLTSVAWFFAVPLAVWLGTCLLAGVVLALRGGGLAGLAAGPLAACMHLAWSMGFLAGLVGDGQAVARPDGTPTASAPEVGPAAAPGHDR